MHKQTFKYRIYPTKNQQARFEQTLEECRWLYNQTLAYRKDAWEQRKESVSLYASNKLLPEWKEQRPSLETVFSQVLQNVQARVDLAFKAFFRRVKNGEEPGYPRFKGKGRYDSFTYTQFGFSLDGDTVYCSKIGNVKIKLHRPIKGRIKTLTIQRTATGKWYACFSVESESEPLLENVKAVGIDMGLDSFATLSTGDKVRNPRFFRKAEKKLAKAQRKLSSAEKGTPERAKKRKVVAHIHERTANQRRDFAHKLSGNLVNQFGTIVFEKLNINGILKNHRLAKSIADAAWNQLVLFTTYKAEGAGRRVILVDSRNTSKMCSRCGSLVEKTLSDRVHSCPHCDLVLDRDVNAAINILARGLASVGTNP